MNRYKFVLLYWLPFILWSYGIYYLSSIPYLKTELGVLDLILRKIAHVFEYAVLLVLAFRAFLVTFKSAKTPVVYLLAFVFSVFYAVLDEFHQSFVPGRGPSAMDVLIDTAGVFSGLALLKFKNRLLVDRKWL